MRQKLGKCYPPYLELISLLLLVLAFYLAWSNYSALPETIPTHFNGHGVPDDWGSKNMIFLFPALSAFIFILLTSLCIWCAATDDPLKLINLPLKWKANLTAEQAEELRIFIIRCLFAMKLIIQGLAAYGIYITIEITCERAAGLGTAWFLFIAAIVALAGFILWKAFRMSRSARPGQKLRH